MLRSTVESILNHIMICTVHFLVQTDMIVMTRMVNLMAKCGLGLRCFLNGKEIREIKDQSNPLTNLQCQKDFSKCGDYIKVGFEVFDETLADESSVMTHMIFNSTLVDFLIPDKGWNDWYSIREFLADGKLSISIQPMILLLYKYAGRFYAACHVI